MDESSQGSKGAPKEGEWNSLRGTAAPVHRRIGGEESCAGVPIRADFSAISEAIPRFKTGRIGREGLKTGALSSALEL